MGTELQHWLSRNRPPRVQITYDVETLGATVKQEIPFIVGIISDLAGGDRPYTPIGERPFVEIDRDSFTTVMEKRVAPTLTITGKTLYKVTRTPDGNAYAPDPGQPLSASLAFKTMDDFVPPAIIQQVPGLAALMKTRQDLADLVAKLGTSPDLEFSLKTSAKAAQPSATAALKAANANLATADTPGTLKSFNDAATAVGQIETADPNKTAIKNAQNAVNDAVAACTTAYTAATAAQATTADVQAAGAKMWLAAVALRDGAALLTRITSSYSTTTDPQKTAVATVTTASDAVATLIPLAATASLYGSSTLALSPSLPTAPTP